MKKPNKEKEDPNSGDREKGDQREPQTMTDLYELMLEQVLLSSVTEKEK